MKVNRKLVIVAVLLCLLVSAGTVQATDSVGATPAETIATAAVPTLVPEQPAVYVVTLEKAQTYAKINDKYVALAETFSKDMEITVTATDGDYAQFEDGYILLTDIVVKPDPTTVSATPIPLVIDPLSEQKSNGASIFMLVFIFLLFLFMSGAAGYMIRGKLDRKKWENDPFRFDPGMRPETTPEPELEPVHAEEKPPYPAYEYMDAEPESVVPATTGKKQKNPGLFAKKEKKSKSAKVTPGGVDPRYIQGGIDAANRPYYYEPEEIDPDGKPFWLENGEKHFYD